MSFFYYFFWLFVCLFLFLPPLFLHLIILYGLPDFYAVCVFTSLLYYCYLFLLYLFISVFISSSFIYFLNCKCLILEKYVWLSAHCKLYRSTFQFCGILSPSTVDKPTLRVEAPHKEGAKLPKRRHFLSIASAYFIGNWMYCKAKWENDNAMRQYCTLFYCTNNKSWMEPEGGKNETSWWSECHKESATKLKNSLCQDVFL